MPRCLAFLAYVALLASAQATTTTPALEVFQLAATQVDEKGLNFPVSETTNFGTTINGRTHQQWPLQTFKGYQYATYYDHNRNVCVARRKLPTGDWETIRFTDYTIDNNDSHNVTVIGIAEGDGSIHLAFDHHKSDLNYRATGPGVATHPESVAWDASLFSAVTDTLGPLGKLEDVTYPRFVPMPNGNLMLYYRYWTSGNGDSMIREYDATTHQWTTGLGKFIARDKATYTWDHDGDGQIATDRSESSPYRYAYINAISYAGSRLHVSWIWRDVFTKTSLTNNHDICYAYSDDDGRTWKNNAGQQVAITGTDAKDTLITLDTPGITVVPIAPGQNAINQCTHYAYPDGSIHLMMRHHVSGSADTRYHHHWRDAAGQWRTQALPFTGSRPSLVGDDDKNLFLAYTNGNRTHIAHGIPNPDKTAWTWNRIFTQDEFNDGGEGVIDFSRWQQERILSTYSQGASPDSNETPTSLHVIDYKIAVPSLEARLDPLTQQVSVTWLSNDKRLQTQTGNLADDAWQFLPEGTSSPIVLPPDALATPSFFRLASPPAPAVHRRFDWNQGEENVTHKHLQSSLSGGILTLTLDPTLHDPYLRLNDGSTDANTYSHVRLRVKNNTAGTDWKIFFAPLDGGEAGNSLNLTPTANGDWETLEVDMRQDPDWQGDIKTIRLDFDTFQSGTVEIDFIEIFQ
ncbi:BNR repeat-containing protein [Pelagicoccus sp. SDUM812005]|uniref:BNR repeat-containing protein n=1 Tax=Pelagicoccus sp. SDUM812005 TaxID=3041257 RepID=UPI00280FA0B8|nr:BNR repeat-containing protein [Pelagicoccus sp. SDUM812005]MDQ8183607.1 BNR repeat-containing protein [Pelagicoccus sp. SDUM812005]